MTRERDRIQENANKYRVKNCPAYIHRPLSTHDRVCLLGDKVKPNHKELYVYCQDCTDCIMKQVIEIAKNIIEKDCYENSDVKAEKILQLFNIEEIRK